MTISLIEARRSPLPPGAKYCCRWTTELYTLRATTPHRMRSPLRRCPRRHDSPRLPDVEGDKPARCKFKTNQLTTSILTSSKSAPSKDGSVFRRSRWGRQFRLRAAREGHPTHRRRLRLRSDPDYPLQDHTCWPTTASVSGRQATRAQPQPTFTTEPSQPVVLKLEPALRGRPIKVEVRCDGPTPILLFATCSTDAMADLSRSRCKSSVTHDAPSRCPRSASLRYHTSNGHNSPCKSGYYGRHACCRHGNSVQRAGAVAFWRWRTLQTP